MQTVIFLVAVIFNGLTFQVNHNDANLTFGSGAIYHWQLDNGASFLIAHVDQAGKYFYELKNGDVLKAIYSDGSEKTYVVVETENVKANNPNLRAPNFFVNGVWSDFWVVLEHFSSPDSLTFYTCFYLDDKFEGRRFVRLEPFEGVVGKEQELTFKSGLISIR